MSGTSAGEGGIYNTVNFSLYHYAGNNPVKYTDPTGAFDYDEKTGIGVIEKGDTLSQIVKKYAHDGVSIEDVARANGISNPDKIYEGNTLKLGFNSPASDSEMLKNNAADMKSHTGNIVYFGNSVKTGGDGTLKQNLIRNTGIFIGFKMN